MAQPLSTVDEVIEALGGLTAAAKLVGRSPQAAWNWRDRKIFPPDCFVLMSAELTRLGKSASPELWGQRTADEVRESAQ
jgi:hypothetical protein